MSGMARTARGALISAALLGLACGAAAVERAFTCEEGGVSTGLPLFATRRPSLASCQGLCAAVAGCHVVTMRRGHCVLYSGEGVVVSGEADSVRCRLGKEGTPYACVQGYSYHEGEDDVTFEGIEALEPCMQECTRIGDCQGVSFQRGVCHVARSEAPQLATSALRTACRRVLAVPTALNASFACDVGAAVGTKLSLDEVPTLAACQASCSALSGCTAASYSGMWCTLFTGSVAVDASTDGVSCAMPHRRAFSCVDGQRHKDSVFALNVQSLRRCKAVCQSFEHVCGAVDYNSDTRECRIIAQGGDLVDADAAVTSCVAMSKGQHLVTQERSGPERDGASGVWAVVDARQHTSVSLSRYFLKQQASFPESAVVARVRAKSSDRCRTLCHVMARCAHFSFASPMCTLLSNTSTADGTGFSKQQRPMTGYRCTRGAYHGGSLSTTHGVMTPDDCTRLCTMSGRCFVAVHHASDKRCVLKSLYAVPTEGVVEASTVCIKSSVVPWDGFHCIDKAFVSGDILTTPGLTSKQCREACLHEQGCRVAQYTPDGICSLKTATAEGPADAAADSCVRLQAPSRLVSVLSGESNETEVHSTATVQLRVRLHVAGLSPSSFSGLHTRTKTQNPALEATVVARVPVGMQPQQFLHNAFQSIGTELHGHDNIFMDKMNPALLHMGLPAMTRTSVQLFRAGFLWSTSSARVVEVPLLFQPSESYDYTDYLNRQWLARLVAAELNIATHLVSMASVSNCYGSGTACRLRWETASADSAGGPQVGGVDTDAPASVKVVLLVETAASCKGLRETLHCDDAEDTYLRSAARMVGCAPCGSFEGDVMDTNSSGAGSDDRYNHTGNSSYADSDGSDSDSDATGQHASRRLLAYPSAEVSRCSRGWMPEAYGTLSELFKVNFGRSTLYNATLGDCISACTPKVGCHAFSRDSSLAPKDLGTCWLKRAMLPTAGDQVAIGSIRTYAVSCPEPVTTCSWQHMSEYKLSGARTVGTSVTRGVSDCQRLCDHIRECKAVVYKASQGTCRLMSGFRYPTKRHGYITSLCHRGTAPEPCERSCGEAHSTECFAFSKHTRVCACAHGFRCTDGCSSPHKPKTCIRSKSLSTLLLEAVALTLNTDTQALQVRNVHAYTGAPTSNGKVTVTKAHVAMNMNHIVSVTIQDTVVRDVLERAADKGGMDTRAGIFTSSLAVRFGIPRSQVSLLTLCLTNSDRQALTCTNQVGGIVSLPRAPLVSDRPSQAMQSAVSWCSKTGASLPDTHTQKNIDHVVRSSNGQMVESRAYWAGATCAESCTNAANWRWQDGSAVNWTSLGIADPLASGHGCSVLRWARKALRWHLAAEQCSASRVYPMCVGGAVPVLNSNCLQDSSCSTEVRFSVQLPYTREVHFVRMQGKAVQYHPTLRLLPHAKLVDLNGTHLGDVDSSGHTTALAHPPLDLPRNPLVKALLPSHTHPTEAVASAVSSSLGKALWDSGLPQAGARSCHLELHAEHLQCVEAFCKPTAPLQIMSTACRGQLSCSDTVCNGNGFVTGSTGFCVCTCNAGFTGVTCGQCTGGFTNYPLCQPSADAAPRSDVYQLQFASGQASVRESSDRMQEQMQSLFSGVASSVATRYVCSPSACRFPPSTGRACNGLSPVSAWEASRRAECTTVAATSRDASVQSAAWSVVEVRLTYTNAYALEGTKAAAVVDSVFETERGSTNQARGLAMFRLMQFHSMTGPEVKDPWSPLTQVVTAPTITPTPPATPAPTSITTDTKVLDDAEGASEDTNHITAAIIGGPILLACACLILCVYQYKKWRMMQQQSTKELTELAEVKNHGEDFLIITKETHESLGVMWDDHTLVVGVRSDTPAARHNADAFINRRLHRINGEVVETLADIREAVDGETVVRLEFVPRFSRIIVRLDEARSDFDQGLFAEAFADRISRNLPNCDYCADDMVVEGITEKGHELHVLIHLDGLRSGEVASIVAMCVTPGNPIREGMPIVGAHLAVPWAEQEAQCTHLWVCCQWLDEAAPCSGVYVQLPHEVNGMPVWQHAPADHWMYSSPSGHWVVVNNQMLVGHATSEYVLMATERHRGAHPFSPFSWRTPLRDAPHVTVSRREPRAHEFVVGQKVRFPETCVMQDGSGVTRGTEGLVMGEADDLVRVCLLNASCDVVTIAPDSLESPDGQRVRCKSGGQWMPATVVAERNGYVKVRFDCHLCEPLWIPEGQTHALLRPAAEDVFHVGDRVVRSDVECTEDGSLEPGLVGTVLTCSDGGQAKPYLVQCATGESWYASRHLQSASGKRRQHRCKHAYDPAAFENMEPMTPDACPDTP